ncbi:MULTISPECIES: VWA domain-containing protein [Streptomyces]|uniref:VWA domain-containing protein n=1 Tax=Streptomyces doebereineriae TaxID=3075528 RepID=A0ABU2V3J6_9ACTN|nr:VWA domain-containing protein [Streptomyces sp. DSM 41640]MDT0480105.1 VWA domain-containing protein [Streptomyces sp. DSM 41640]
MGILTLLRNAFGGRSRKGAATEAEGAETTPSQETAPKVPSPAPEPTPAKAATVPEPRTSTLSTSSEHELVAAAFDKAAASKPTPSAETPATKNAEIPTQPVPAEAAPETPVAEESAPEKPEAESAATAEAPAEEPVAEEAAVQQTAAEEPATEEPAADEPVAEEAAVEEPAPVVVAEEKPLVAEAAPEPVVEPEPEAAPEPAATPTAEAVPEPKPEPAAEVTPDSAVEPEPDSVQEPEPVAAEAAQPVAEVTPEPEQPSDSAPETVVEPEPQPTAEVTPEQEPEPAVTAAADDALAAADGETSTGGDDLAVPPTLRTAYTAAATALTTHSLTGTTATTYLVLDRSASMRPYYKDGSAQALGEQTLALAAHLDPESKVHVVFFSTELDGTGEITLTDHENKIDDLHAGLGRMGRTSYHAAVEEVLAHHTKNSPDTPALVVFQTDGAPDAKTPATQALTEAAKTHPAVFFSFVAFGDPENKAFDYLRKLKLPNTSHFLAGATPKELTDAEIYEGILANWRP